MSASRSILSFMLVALGCGSTSVTPPATRDAVTDTQTVDNGPAPVDDGPAPVDNGPAPADVPVPPNDVPIASVDVPVAPADRPADMPTPLADSGLPRFSFFVTSLRALQDLSRNPEGFGGDLRFGETGPGAGLRGADRICATIAERSMPGSARKVWRAFLSVADDGTGHQVNAIDRVGPGPWYDRLGRLFANNTSEFIGFRPTMADPAIRNDFPNEDGVPNHRPDPTAGPVDNHDMLTGSNAQGRLYNRMATCLDWTSSSLDRNLTGRPRVGHSWPRNTSGGRPTDGYGHWISSLDEAGCGAGVRLVEMGPPRLSDPTVGSGGGYGGFYCFALSP